MSVRQPIVRQEKTNVDVGNTRVFDNVAELNKSNVPNNKTCILLGYYEPGDFGHPLTLIADKDRKGVHSYELKNGKYANLFFEGPLNVLWYGAYNDNTNATTTTAAIQTAINEAGSYFYEGRNDWINARCVFFPRGEYAINDSILVETGVTLIGETPHPGGLKVWDQANHGTKLRPTTSDIALRLRSNCTIQNMVLQHGNTDYGDQGAALPADSNYTVLKSWVNNGIAIGSSDADSFASNGVNHGYGCCIRDCIIAGFNEAVNFTAAGLGGGRYRIENVLIDCWNGVYIEGTGDICRLRDVQCWPLLESISGVLGANDRIIERGGTGFKIKRGGDWAQIHGCYAFGYQVGLELEDANMTNVVQFAFDGSDTGNQEIRSNPVYGLKIIGESKNTIVTNYHSGGHPTDGCIPVYINIDSTLADPVSLVQFSNCLFSGFDDIAKVEIDNCKFASFTNCAFLAGDKTFQINADMGLNLQVNNSSVPAHPSTAIIYNNAAGYTTNTINWHNNVVSGTGTFQVN